MKSSATSAPDPSGVSEPVADEVHAPGLIDEAVELVTTPTTPGNLMRLALAQYPLSDAIDKNLTAALALMRRAAEAGAHMVLFPELSVTPFFPQYAGTDASRYLADFDDERLRAFQKESKGLGIWSVPNLYWAERGRNFDASFMISPEGKIVGISKMVHVAQAPGFYEQDYYTPSDAGFHVYQTPFARVGVVVCFDRHFPESIRTCVLQGAQLILIPTANTISEPRELFEWELRVSARQNGVWIAMCNRVGTEGETTFCGDSLVVDPDGNVAAKAGEDAQLLLSNVDPSLVVNAWQRSMYLELLRPDRYLSTPIKERQSD